MIESYLIMPKKFMKVSIFTLSKKQPKFHSAQGTAYSRDYDKTDTGTQFWHQTCVKYPAQKWVVDPNDQPFIGPLNQGEDVLYPTTYY